MKRDMDLVREILLKVEATAPDVLGATVEIDRRSKAEVCGHVELLVDAGLVDARIAARQQHFVIFRMTWAGHEFLDSARNESIWRRAKTLAIEKGCGLSMLALQLALTELIKRGISGV